MNWRDGGCRLGDRGRCDPPVTGSGAILCGVNLGPFCAIASGALLICIDPAVEMSTVRRLRRARVPVARIGRVVERSNGVTLAEGGRERQFPRFAVDELTRVLGSVRERLM